MGEVGCCEVVVTQGGGEVPDCGGLGGWSAVAGTYGGVLPGGWFECRLELSGPWLHLSGFEGGVVDAVPSSGSVWIAKSSLPI